MKKPALALLVVTVVFASGHAQVPRLTSASFVYRGAFRVPATIEEGVFNYNGRSIAFNPATKGLFVVGRDNDATVRTGQKVAEISIPDPVVSNSIEDLPRAAVLQNFVEPSEGRFLQAAVRGTPLKIGGMLVRNGRLFFTEYAYYDASNSQKLSHLSRPVNLSTAGDVRGPFGLKASVAQGDRAFSGWLLSVPDAWQATFGPALTGQCCINISATISNGPSLFAWNPDQLAAGQAVKAALYYPVSSPLGVFNHQSILWNGTTWMGGAVWIDPTPTLLFVGTQGLGQYCYGNGTSDMSLAGTRNAARVPYCYDPAVGSHGGHTYPYVHQVWLYDANDLQAVIKGKAPWSPKPYALWNPSLPFERSGHILNGVAYDPVRKWLILEQRTADGVLPLFHVFEVQTRS